MHVLAVAAEFERSVIRERINAGLAAAKERGAKPGLRRKLHLHRNAVANLMQRAPSGRTIAVELNIPTGSVFAVMQAARRDGKTWSTTKAARKGG